ncbi:MAG: HTH domain-containing protein [Candidatus Dormibacteraeota bacterium]|nr:HTH domain-containing protein [Candidatus Dormibacteraeota bacterium]
MTRSGRFARRQRILAAVLRRPGFTPAGLAAGAGVSERTLRRDLAQLRRDGYHISYSGGYQVQELLRLDGGSGFGVGLGAVYEHQLRMLRDQVPATVAEWVEKELEAEAPAALASLIAALLERRLT